MAYRNKRRTVDDQPAGILHETQNTPSVDMVWAAEKYVSPVEAGLS
jgi:hypothetical protein